MTLGNHDCSGDTASQYEWAAETTRSGKREITMKPYYQVTEALPGKRAVLKMFVLDMCTFVCGDMTVPDARCSASDMTVPFGIDVGPYEGHHRESDARDGIEVAEEARPVLHWDHVTDVRVEDCRVCITPTEQGRHWLKQAALHGVNAATERLEALDLAG